jgi:hypothetical protein
MNITWADVRAFRLARQHLHRRAAPGELLEVVRDVCGIHAQLQSAMELQIWARVQGVGRKEIGSALWERRELVRTWSMRGTLHVFAATDLPLYIGALSQHDRWWKGAWLRMIGMSEEELRAVLAAIKSSLGARPLTRSELAEKVEKKVGTQRGTLMLSGWGEMLKPAAFQGHLCSGPPRGQSVTFVRPDRWLEDWAVPPPEQAWREIVRRYLSAYGPASREEFGRWWGMAAAPAGRALHASGLELVEVEVEGYRGWILEEDRGALGKPPQPPSLRLLPAFDVYVAGNRPRASLVDPLLESLIFRKAGWISPVVVVDGAIAGVWKHELTGRRLEVTVTPFEGLGAKGRRFLCEEADRLGDFLGAPASVTFEGPSRQA